MLISRGLRHTFKPLGPEKELALPVRYILHEGGVDNKIKVGVLKKGRGIDAGQVTTVLYLTL